eukprot:scaffold131_cov632-Prasinococcus_capsulatus_cf.AAC.1
MSLLTFKTTLCARLANAPSAIQPKRPPPRAGVVAFCSQGSRAERGCATYRGRVLSRGRGQRVKP